MSLYSFTKEEDGFALLEEGDYEATLERIQEKTTPTGKKKLSLQFRVRSDVEQPSKNRVLFDDIWEERENPGVYNRARLNKVMNTQDFEDGKEFDDLDAVIRALEGCDLIIHVKKEFDDYRGEDVNRIVWYAHTKHGATQISATVADASAASTKAKKAEAQIPDEFDDCPF